MDAPLPDISVIIPHLNQVEALRACLRSLDRQSFAGRFETIVVDNGSNAPPHDAIAEFAGARLEHERTPGPGPARNRGVAAARGAILAFIDADCTADPEWLSVIHRRLREPGRGPILGGDVRIARNDPTRLTALEAYESVFSYRQRDYIEKQGFSGTGNLAVRRADFDAIGPFAGIEAAEDRRWGEAAAARGYRVVYVPEMIVFHPARRSLAELAAKWDRHIRHDHEAWHRKERSTAAWLARAGAIAVSPLFDARKVLRSRRIAGAPARAGALVLLAQIRLYRCRQMVRIAFHPQEARQWQSWNRPVRPR